MAHIGEVRALELGFMHYLVVCPFVFLAGFVDAVAGGGGLISLPAYLLIGLPVHMAIGTNKLGSAMGTATACWRYGKRGFIDRRLAPLCICCALGGAAGGAGLALCLSDGAFRLLMLVILPVTALYVMRAKELTQTAEIKASGQGIARKRQVITAALAAFFIGVYDGFYGPGTGTFLLLLLTGAAHMSLEGANGLCKVINLATNLSALLVFFLNGQVIISLGLAAGCFSMAGNYLGSRCFIRQGANIAKPIILIVITIFFIKTLWELLADCR